MVTLLASQPTVPGSNPASDIYFLPSFFFYYIVQDFHSNVGKGLELRVSIGVRVGIRVSLGVKVSIFCHWLPVK